MPSVTNIIAVNMTWVLCYFTWFSWLFSGYNKDDHPNWRIRNGMENGMLGKC